PLHEKIPQLKDPMVTQSKKRGCNYFKSLTINNLRYRRAFPPRLGKQRDDEDQRKARGKSRQQRGNTDRPKLFQVSPHTSHHSPRENTRPSPIPVNLLPIQRKQ